MSPIKRYILERVVMYLIVILLALSINFIIPRLIPGDPIGVIIGRLSYQGGRIGAEELVQEYKRMFGLDKDLPTQFILYLKELLRGNLGYSIQNFPTTVNELIARSLPWTLVLLSVTSLTSWFLGTLLGAIVGWRGEESKLGKVLAPLTLTLSTVPYYLLAIVLMFFLAYLLPIFPVSGGYSLAKVPNLSIDFLLDVMWHSVLPVLSILLSSLGWWFLSMRSMIMSVSREDFVLMAEAQGISDREIMWKYAFRNSLLPQITGLALSLGNIFGGALLTEVIFAYPGMGWLLYNAITTLDYTLIQGIILLIVISVCSATLLIDLIYPLVDPRIKYGE